jgi:hypothetical protein
VLEPFFSTGADYAGDNAVGRFEQTFCKMHIPHTINLQTSERYEQHNLRQAMYV